jgi:hypothetical protein
MSDRKYRHRGYQDDGDERPKPQRPAGGPGPGPGRMEGAPRGRGSGIPAEAVFKCARCGTQAYLDEVTPASECEKCGSALYSCSNCAFFDTGRRFECRKPVEARIESKHKANECEYYQPKMVRDLKPAQKRDMGSPKTPNDARAAFDALFKK